MSKKLPAARGQLLADILTHYLADHLSSFPCRLVAFLCPQPGEFGSIVFISGNLPFETEVTSLLVFIRLDEYDYPAAAALAFVMLITAFLMLLVTNLIQARQLRYAER